MPKASLHEVALGVKVYEPLGLMEGFRDEVKEERRRRRRQGGWRWGDGW